MTTTATRPTVVPLPRRAPTAWIQGTLALSLADPEADAPPAPVHALHGRAVESWAGRFAQAATEIAGGNRPVTQVLRHTSSEVYADLARRAQLVAAAVGVPAGQGLLQGRQQLLPLLGEVGVRRGVGPAGLAGADQVQGGVPDERHHPPAPQLQGGQGQEDDRPLVRVGQ